MRLSELLPLIRADLDRILSYFPEIILVWPEVHLARGPQCRGGRTHEADFECQNIFVRSRAGVVVRHRQLEGDNRRLMRFDGV